MTVPLFIVGTGRCGSSLLQELIARHPQVGFISNIDDLLAPLDPAGRWNQAIYRRVPSRLTRKGRGRFAPSEGYHLLDRYVSPMISDTRGDLTADDVTPWLEQRMRAFFDRRASVQGTPVFAHKFTGWPRAAFLARIFPEARFVHVVRDGRAVANSFLQMPWWRGWEGPAQWRYGELQNEYWDEWERSGRSLVVLAAITWKLLIDAHEAAFAAVDPQRHLVVRYEDLLSLPTATLEPVLDLVDLPATEGFGHAVADQRFARDRVEAYRRDLTVDQVAQLERSLGEHLQRFDYVDTPLRPVRAAT